MDIVHNMLSYSNLPVEQWMEALWQMFCFISL
jgi:hypothetical protein